MAQITNHIMMIRPANFGFNEETADNNAFQNSEGKDLANDISQKAQAEFDNMVSILRSEGVNVIVVEDTVSPVKPDAIFPNNWISFHQDGSVITYPMYAKNRRIERREDIVHTLGKEYEVSKRYDFHHYEGDELYLEGTGSMIFDRDNKIVYACISERTDPTLLEKFSVLMDMKKIAFSSVDRKGFPIYHTNVMMALGKDFAVICLDSITDSDERELVINTLKTSGKEIVAISYEQMEQFAGNMLQVSDEAGNPILVMSQTAYDSLNQDQIAVLESKTQILPIGIDTIEYYGGGSVRCMMAEVFLPKKK